MHSQEQLSQVIGWLKVCLRGFCSKLGQQSEKRQAPSPHRCPTPPLPQSAPTRQVEGDSSAKRFFFCKNKGGVIGLLGTSGSA